MNTPVVKPDIEARFIAALVVDGSLERLNACRKLRPEAFANRDHRELWKRLQKAKDRDEVESIAMRYVTVDDGNGMFYFQDRTQLYLNALAVLGIDRVDEWRDTLPSTGTNLAVLRQLVDDRRFNFANQLTKPEPRFLIQGKGVATPGNICNIIAQAKSGKSALIGAWITAAIVAESGEEADTLGVTATAPNGRILLHIDSEQSCYDADAHIRRALARASADTAPVWLWSYHLAGFSAGQIRAALSVLLPEAEAAGGVFAVIVDGVADLVDDVNNPDTCNPFVAEVQGMAIRYDCPIVTVIHENPTQDSGKPRGHLGSQLTRKAESNIRLKKIEGVTVVFADQLQRGAPILEKDGPAFQWDDAAQMHVSVHRTCPKIAELSSLASEVFQCASTLSYTDVRKGIEAACGCKEKTAEKKFTALKKAGLIRSAGAGKWMLAA